MQKCSHKKFIKLTFFWKFDPKITLYKIEHLKLLVKLLAYLLINHLQISTQSVKVILNIQFFECLNMYTTKRPYKQAYYLSK